MSGLFVIAVFLSVPVMVISHYISLSRKNKILMSEMEQPVQPPEIDSVYATVLKKDVSMEKTHLNSKTGGHQLIFTIEFLCNNGEKLLLSVPEEMYESFYIGQTGILATINGEFFDFGDDEEISIN